MSLLNTRYFDGDPPLTRWLWTISDDVRIQFQHTLMKAVSGEQAAASFGPALEPPYVLPDDELMTEFDTQMETADVRDWFKNEVW